MSSEEAVGSASGHTWGRRFLFGLVFVAAAAVYVGARYGARAPFPTFVGACQRLKASGLPITSKDWFCDPAPWTRRASYLAANLFVWLTFVVPCAILAATGRRFTALLPMLVVPFFTFSGGDVVVRWWGTEYWPGHAVFAVAVNLLGIGVPVVLISVMSRKRRPRSGVDPSMISVFLSGAVLLGPSFAIVMYARSLIGGPLSVIDASAWTGVLPMAVFGALLGPNRRWWPWSVAPVAVLMSFGPTIAILASPTHFQIWTLFRAVMPLAAVGMVWTAWWPLSVGVTKRVRRSRPAADLERRLAVPLEVEAAPTAPAQAPKQRRPIVRPGVVLDSLAIALLAISVIIFHADPLPAELGASLPTFLGVRTNWQDVRTRMDLREAMSAMDAYASQHGTFRGATATDGAAADASLVWKDPSTLSGSLQVPALTMVVSNHGTAARIGALSASGSAFCVERSRPGAPLTYSTAPDAPGPTTQRDKLRTAFAACRRTPWTPSLLTAVPIVSLCDGRDSLDEGYMICRMVQALGVEIMSNPKPRQV